MNTGKLESFLEELRMLVEREKSVSEIEKYGIKYIEDKVGGFIKTFKESDTSSFSNVNVSTQILQLRIEKDVTLRDIDLSSFDLSNDESLICYGGTNEIDFDYTKSPYPFLVDLKRLTESDKNFYCFEATMDRTNMLLNKICN